MLSFSQRQVEIIKVSFEIISNDGFAELSMKNIAKLIGIKESSLYNHFESKKAILKGIYAYIDSKIDNFSQKINNADCSEIDKVKLLFFSLCNVVEVDPSFTKLILRHFYQYDPYFKEDYIDLFDSLDNFFYYVVDKAVKAEKTESYFQSNFIVAVIKGCAREIAVKKLQMPDYAQENDRALFWQNIDKVINLK